MNKRYEKLAEEYTNSTIEDIYGAMTSVEEISECFGMEIANTNKWYQIDEDTYLNVSFTQKTSSRWIYLEVFDKADYIANTVDYIAEMKEDYSKYVVEMNELELAIMTFEEYAGI